MSLHDDLLDHAQRLSELDPTVQNEADCRRAVSAAYYALFHLVVAEAAPLFATDTLLTPETRQRLEYKVRRMFGHTELRGIAENLDTSRDLKDFFKGVLDNTNPSRPPLLRDFAKAFVELQKKRLLADYEISERFDASTAKESVHRARGAFENWNAVKNEPMTRVFLAALLLQQLSKRREDSGRSGGTL